MSQTCADVDSSPDARAAVGWQDRMAAWPAVAAYKRRTHDLLANATSVLDVGCGPGTDLLALGLDRCLGVDSSVAMCSRAAARGGAVARADARALPFRSSSLAGVRADRVIQHVADPTQALSELVRVVQPGGRIVIVDPDQESLVIHVPGVRQSVVDRLKALCRDIGYHNGRLISHVPTLLAQLAVTDITLEPYPLVLADPTEAFGLPGWPHAWRHEGAFTHEELAEWDQAIQNPGAGFIYLLTFLLVAGEKR